MTKNEKAIITYLKNKGWVSPTEIGRKVGGYKNTAFGTPTKILRDSRWASPICSRLNDKGILERNMRGHYYYNGE
jgi:hypothetical protein